ncbi:MAG: hypothetical protein K2Q18_09665, partial [Bdellovibrionales bacterium]|nr:hypothetical protein [Bdellovibrionales bacterium]
CAEIVNSKTGDKKRFIRNLPFDKKTGIHDRSSIVCTANKKTLSPAECSNQYELISDEFGRGLELRSKKTNYKNVAITVTKDGANCTDLSLDTGPEVPGDTGSKPYCETITKKAGYIYIENKTAKKCDETACKDHKPDGFPFVWNDNKKSCVPTQCKKSDQPGISIIIDVETFLCVPKKCEEIVIDGKKQKWDDTKKECVPDDKKADVILDRPGCESQIKEDTIFIYDEITKVCSETACGNYKIDGFPYKWNKELKKCVPTGCRKSTIKEYEVIIDPKTFQCSEVKCEDKPASTGKKFTWKDEKCIEIDLKPRGEASEDAKKCEEKQKAWQKETGQRGTKWAWDGKTCVDKKPSPKDDDEEGNAQTGEAPPQFQYKQPPGRFQPIDGSLRRGAWGQMWSP